MADVHHGHAVRSELEVPGHGAGLAGREHLCEQRGDRLEFDTDLKNAVTAGFAQQSTKYSGLIPRENPLRYFKAGSAPLPAVPTPVVPSYTAAEQAQLSPVHPAGTAPEALMLSSEDDASAFWNRGIPGFSVGGVQDSNIDGTRTRRLPARRFAPRRWSA